MNSSLLEDGHLKRISSLPNSYEIDIFVTAALRYVIQHVFSDISRDFTITISIADLPTDLWLQNIFGQLFATWSFMAVQLIVHDNNHKFVHVLGRRYCNIILVDSYENLRNARIAEHNKHFDTLEYYFIFLHIRDAWMPEHRAKILKYCFDNYWLHCNVMIQDAQGEILLYTYFPFQDKGCFRTEPVLINKFNGERFANHVIFPNKLGNLHGCPLKLTAWQVPPYIAFPRKRPATQLFGLEMTILRGLSKFLNCSLKVDDAVEDRHEHSNGTTVHRDILNMSYVHHQLERRETNITAGYLRRTTRLDKAFTPSAVLYNLPLKFLVLQRHSRYEYMTVLVSAFDRHTWILILFSSFLMFVINCIRRKYDPRHIDWPVVETLLGGSACRCPKYVTLRTTFIIWVLSTFFIRTMYQSRLFLLYRTSFYKAPPLTVDDLVEGGYKAVCTQTTEEFVDSVPEIMNNSMPLIVLNTSDEMAPMRYLEKHYEENLAAVTLLDFVLYYARTELRGNRVIITPPTVNTQLTSFYFTKHSFLTQRFNEGIMRFHQAGLIHRWRKLSTAVPYISQKTGLAGRFYGRALMINMRQVSGFMLIIITLYVAAIIVFALELVSKKVKCLRKCF